jgi:glycosyltransferase involved in cell wall biosynthesis
MDFLIVSLYPVWPDVMHSGGQDLFHLITALSDRHTVHLAAFGEEAAAARLDEMRAWCRTVRLVKPAVTWRRKLRSALRERRPWRWGRRAHAEMAAHVAALSPQVDIVQFVWTPMGRYARYAGRAIRVLDCVDVNFIVRDAERRCARGVVGRLRAELAYRRERAREVAYARACQMALVRSARDARLLAAATGDAGSVFVLPPFVEREALSTVRPGEAEGDTVLFVGAMDRARNVRAVRWFCSAVWPRVREGWPGARFVIVGAHPEREVRALGALPGVQVTGAVDDLRPWYARCRVVVAPMRSDAGALAKIIEAMWAGRPVVATSLANAGLEAPPSEALLVADSPQAFAGAVLRLLGEPDTWARVGAGGRRFAQTHLHWEEALRRLEQTYVRLAGS